MDNNQFDTIFIGTAPYGEPVLDALANRDDIRLRGVFSQPDRRRGRGQKKQSPPIIDRAKELSLETFQPENINEEAPGILKDSPELDFAIVIAFGQIISREVFERPKLGTFNFHASLLPRWRGAAPIRHTILSGDEETGVTVFRLTGDLDAGPICEQKTTTVRSGETYGELYDRLSELNVDALDDLLSDIRSGNLSFSEQTGEVTYANKIGSDDALIDWSSTAEDVERQVLAFCPKPGAYTFFDSDRFKIYSVQKYNEGIKTDVSPGTIIELKNDSIIVRAGEGSVAVKNLQPAGSRRMSAEEYLRGNPQLEAGDQFKRTQ